MRATILFIVLQCAGASQLSWWWIALIATLEIGCNAASKTIIELRAKR